MGELALRRIQAGVETTRGTAVAATRKVYGTMTITRSQPSRFAMEDRGNLEEKWRNNAKTVEAGFSIVADATFEDTPWYSTLFADGVPNIAGTGSANLGYLWGLAPDMTSDTLQTVTWEAGDDTVAWQGPFGIADTADFALTLDDALTLTLGGFVADWTPQNYASPGLATTFTGFTTGLTERVVESVMGYQTRFFLDTTGTVPGTTWVQGRFIGANFGWHNQNKRKIFGDGYPKYTNVGRGKRQTSAQITFEAKDTNQYADFVTRARKICRIQLIGTPVSTTQLTTVSGAGGGSTMTTIPVTAQALAIPGGTPFQVGLTTVVTSPAGAAANATTIPIVSQFVNAYPSGTGIFPCKSMMFDFAGAWDAFQIGNRDTNTTFQMTLQAMYDTGFGAASAITIINGKSTL